MTNTIFMNMSADGFIAKSDDDVPFISDLEWDTYLNIVGKADAIIVGRKTYDLMIEADDLEELKNPRTVVVTKNKTLQSSSKKITFSADEPSKIIKNLENEGFKNIFISGGAEINSLFLKSKDADLLTICISPYLLGSGISFLKDSSCEQKLKLNKTSTLDNGSIIIEYSIEK